MSGTVSLYSTTALQGILRSLKQPSSFLSGQYFKQIIVSDKEEIAFDVEETDEQLAPFVAPQVEGEIVLEDGFTTDLFKPAYIKIKTPLLPYKNIARTIGETIGGGDITPAQRQQLRIAATLAKHQARIARRIEAMASECLREGKVTVSGDKYVTKIVDYKRDPSLRITLLGTDRWHEAGSDPLQDIEDWCQMVFDLSGAIVDEITFGSDAAKWFKANERVQKVLAQQVQGGAVAVNVNGQTIQFGPTSQVAAGAQHIGNIGKFKFFQYNGSYKIGNQRTRILSPNGVLGVDSVNYGGIRHFGAIMEADALQAVQNFVKSWVIEDPSSRVVLTATAPLLSPAGRDRNFYAEVGDSQ